MVKCNFRLPQNSVYEDAMKKGTVITKEIMENQLINWYECDLVSSYPHRCDEEECIFQIILNS